MIIHVLYQGSPLCGFMPGHVPKDWPKDHKWVDNNQREMATCEGCKAEVERDAYALLDHDQMEARITHPFENHHMSYLMQELVAAKAVKLIYRDMEKLAKETGVELEPFPHLHDYMEVKGTPEQVSAFMAGMTKDILKEKKQ